ncbi:heparinase II/III family protein [Kocuria sp. TGY1127_2]|uniref:heparinase II/III domain-containing protein n=1 Tax=Kocuria sp. TGY1127_2 TaxID=2711328 RepID=UPI0015B8EBDB|nr:heparinase II/III family protein [Kocuria sp. TGY1127_2]
MVNVEAARKQIVRKKPNTKTLAEVMNGEVLLRPHPMWRLNEPMDWTANPFQDKNWRCQLHMLRWLEPLRAAGAQGDSAAASKWLTLAHDWFINNRPPHLTDDEPAPDSWVDMIEAIRAVHLAQAVPMLQDLYPDELPWLIQSLEEHLAWLADESHIGRANHALHQHEALMVCALVLEDRDHLRLALDRLVELYEQQWDDEGVNAEGAIAYHRNNYIWWNRLIWRMKQAGIKIPEAMDSLDKVPEELAHATRPDGLLSPIGDTDDAAATQIDHPACLYVTSQGAQGSPPEENVKLYHDGYLFGRSGWGEFERDMAEETFFSMVFGRFKVHGHEDGGSMTFSAQGVNWITDPGKYSYTHTHPMRLYVTDHNHHSLVYLKDGKRKSREPVSLISAHLTGPIWDATVEDDGYRNVNIRRRVVFSTVGEYLVIVDTVRSNHSVTAVQRWQLGPDVQAHDNGASVQLVKGEKTAVLAPSGISPECTIHESPDEDNDFTGHIATAWKTLATAPVVEFSKTGEVFRFITVVVASHRNTASVENLPGLPRGYFGLKISNGAVTENIVIGENTRHTFDEGTDVETIRRALDKADEPASETDAADEPAGDKASTTQAMRKTALELASQARESAWKATAKDRQEILQSFGVEAKALNLPADLDFGLATTAADLNPRSKPGQYGPRGSRGPLINWTRNPRWRPTFYDLPVVSHPESLRPRKLGKKPQLHTVDLGPLVLPMALAPDPGSVLTVQFHGAIDRNKTQIPIFQRMEFQRGLSTGPTMNLADPTLDLSSTLRLGWYMGVAELDLHEAIAHQIHIAARALGVDKVVLQGGSGGGFAALQVGSFLPEASVIAFNAQTDVRMYHAHSAAAAFEASFGTREAPTDPALIRRVSVIERLSHGGSLGNVYLVSNPGDTFHTQHHEQPLSHFLDSQPVAKSHATILYDLGPGHRSPNNEQYSELMSRVYSDQGIAI